MPQFAARKPTPHDRIFARAGRDWTDEERRKVKLWLEEPQQFRRLVIEATRLLGPDSALAAWGDFWNRKMDHVISQYEPPDPRPDPQLPRRGWFWPTYLLACFVNFCKDRAPREPRVVRGQDDDGADNDDPLAGVPNQDTGTQPEETLLGKAWVVGDDRGASRYPDLLPGCIQLLPVQHRDLLEQHYIHAARR